MIHAMYDSVDHHPWLAAVFVVAFFVAWIGVWHLIDAVGRFLF